MLNSLYQTPLHPAAVQAGVDCARLLISRGEKAAVNVIDNEGDTPLLKYLSRGLFDPPAPDSAREFLALLLEAGASLVTLHEGLCRLYEQWADDFKPDAVPLRQALLALVTSHRLMDRHNTFGSDTLPYLMCAHGAPEEDIRLAPEFRADPHAADLSGCTPLQCLADRDDTPLARILHE